MSREIKLSKWGPADNRNKQDSRKIHKVAGRWTMAFKCISQVEGSENVNRSGKKEVAISNAKDAQEAKW